MSRSFKLAMQSRIFFIASSKQSGCRRDACAPNVALEMKDVTKNF
jgi:hypothetical protein